MGFYLDQGQALSIARISNVCVRAAGLRAEQLESLGQGIMEPHQHTCFPDQADKLAMRRTLTVREIAIIHLLVQALSLRAHRTACRSVEVNDNGLFRSHGFAIRHSRSVPLCNPETIDIRASRIGHA